MKNQYSPDRFGESRSEDADADASGGNSDNTAILDVINAIEDKFDEEHCKNTIGDPDKADEWIQNRLNSIDLDELSYSTIPHFYQMYRNGEISGVDLLSQLEKLLEDLDRDLREFADMVAFGIPIPTEEPGPFR